MGDISTPWDFEFTSTSPNGRYKIIYDNPDEFGMGTPLGGPCYLEIGNERMKIHDWCGGPPVWEIFGYFVAISIWTKKFWKGIVAQLGIVSINDRKLTIYNDTFGVLHLLKYEGNIIKAIDSPAFLPNEIFLDTNRLSVDKEIDLA